MVVVRIAPIDTWASTIAVGINVAVQDAVAAGTLLAKPLREHRVPGSSIRRLRLRIGRGEMRGDLPAYRDSTISSTSVSRRWRFFTICGSNVLTRSRGTSIVASPATSEITVFDREPLRTFVDSRPGSVWCFERRDTQSIPR